MGGLVDVEVSTEATWIENEVILTGRVAIVLVWLVAGEGQTLIVLKAPLSPQRAGVLEEVVLVGQALTQLVDGSLLLHPL